MSQAVSKFVHELSLHFGKRFESEAAEDDWLKSMLRNLRGYDADVLEKGAQRIIDTRKDRYFPLPSECKAACDEVLKWKELEKPRLSDGIRQERTYEGQYALANDLIHTEMGRRAAREGWILSLHDFIRNNGRLPYENEAAKCMASARGFDEAYDAVLRGEGGVACKALEALGDSMAARREAFRQKVLGVKA